MIFDDRPAITLTVSMGQAFIIKDALCAASFLAEENWASVASFLAVTQQGLALDTTERDAIHEMLRREMEPIIRESAERIRRIMEEAKEQHQKLLDEMEMDDD